MSNANFEKMTFKYWSVGIHKMNSDRWLDSRRINGLQNFDGALRLIYGLARLSAMTNDLSGQIV